MRRRQESGLISLKELREIYKQVDRHKRIHRPQGDFISISSPPHQSMEGSLTTYESGGNIFVFRIDSQLPVSHRNNVRDVRVGVDMFRDRRNVKAPVWLTCIAL